MYIKYINKYKIYVKYIKLLIKTLKIYFNVL